MLNAASIQKLHKGAKRRCNFVYEQDPCTSFIFTDDLAWFGRNMIVGFQSIPVLLGTVCKGTRDLKSESTAL